MKPLTSAIAVALLALALSYHSQAQAPAPQAPAGTTTTAAPITDPPPGISPSAWISISDKFGFVITRPALKPPTYRKPGTTQDIPIPNAPASTVTGYFMIFRDGRWLRIETEPPSARAFPAL